MSDESESYEKRQRRLASARIAITAIEDSKQDDEPTADGKSKGKPAPEFDPRIDYPERYSDGRPI